MFIKKLQIHNFRIIQQAEYCFSDKINIFYGKNGIGKTTILEAIYYVSTGKSFRKGSFKNLINFNADQMTVFIKAEDFKKQYTLAVNKHSNSKWFAKLNHSKITKQSEITNLLPIVSIDPEIYRLVDYGPIYRRSFLDWLVFHVKHDYLLLWKKTYKCIKYLNALYKSKASNAEIEIWEKNFLIYSNQLNKTRIAFFNNIKPKILNLTKFLQPEIEGLNISFIQGWTQDNSLEQQLDIDRSKNFAFGKLNHGPHKMDIKINIHKQGALYTLSRGQKKILSITFYLAFIQTLLEHDIKPILCLDDFDAELDSEKLSKVSKFIVETNTQVFITSVQKDKIKKAFPDAKMFHVKHSS